MATEILRPQDALVGRYYGHATSCSGRRALPANGGLALNRNQQKRPSTKHERRKSNVAAAEVKKSQDGRRKGGVGDLAMGQVTILRRGHSLASKIGDAIPSDPREGGVGDLGMGQVTLLRRGESLASKIGDAIPSDPIQNIPPLKIVFDSYAGADFDLSPSPRCLPLPSFCNRKGEAFEEDATKSLRRMLGLD